MGRYKEPVKNERWFREINTSKKKWMIGLVFADGCICNVTKTSKYGTTYIYPRFTFSNTNYNSVKMFADTFDKEINIQKKVGVTTEINGKKVVSRKPLYSCSVHSDLLVLDLLNSGIDYHKTYSDNIKILSMTDNHLLRGIFDGDGTISGGLDIDSTRSKKYGRTVFKKRVSFYPSSNYSKIVASSIIKVYEDIFKFKPNALLCVGGTCYFGARYSIKDVLQIYHFLYKDCEDLYFPEKKEKFESIFRVYDIEGF